MTALALAPMHHDTTSTDHWTRSRVNPLQQLLADAMREAGIPLEKRGSKARLAVMAKVEDAIVSNIFNRPRYVPEADVRQRIAAALGIPRRAIDSAAAEIKGLRVYTTQPAETTGGDVVRQLDAVTDTFLLAFDEMTPEELDEAAAAIQRLSAERDRAIAEVKRRSKTDQ